MCLTCFSATFSSRDKKMWIFPPLWHKFFFIMLLYIFCLKEQKCDPLSYSKCSSHLWLRKWRLWCCADRSPKLLKYQNKFARMGLLTSHKALRSTPFRKTRKRNNYTQKLNKLRIITSFSSSSTGSPPATPFNSTTFLMGLQELREFKNSYHQLKFDQYGSMEHLLACWPLDELSPDQADLINDDGYGNIAHGDVLIASFSPTARSRDDHAISEHGVITGCSSCDSVDEDDRIVRNTHGFITATREYGQECSSTVDVLSSSSLQLRCSENLSLQSLKLEQQMDAGSEVYCSSDQRFGQNSGISHSL